MYKKILILVLSLILLIPSLLINISAQGNISASFEGPKTLAQGQQAEMTFSIDGEAISACSGEIKFDTKKLEFVEASIDVAEFWEFETNSVEDVIYFACADTKGKNSLSGKNEIFTITFNVLSFKQGDTITVTASEIKTSDGEETVNAENAVYSCTFGSSDTEDSNENSNGNTDANGSDAEFDYTDFEKDDSSSGNSNEKSHNNMLEKLVVKNAEISPKFDPEIKKYEAQVPFEIKELEVEAVAADPNAKVEISDTELIYVGKNITKIVVYSESGLKRTYKIYTTRLAPEKSVGSDKGFDFNLIWIILLIVGALLVIAAIVLLIIFRKKIFKRKV